MTEKTLKEELLEILASTRSPKRFELVVPQGVKVQTPAKVIAETQTVRTLSFDDSLFLEGAVLEVLIGRGGAKVPYTSIHELFGKEYGIHRQYELRIPY